MERHLASCGALGMRMQVSASPVVGVEPAVYAPKALLLPSQYGAPPLRSDEDDETPYGTTRAPHLHVHPSAAAWARAADDDTPHHQQQQPQQPQAYGYADAGDRGAHESLHLMKADGAGQASIVDVDRKPRKPAKREIFVCPEVHCGKQFPRSFALRRHMRIHTGTKPYACDFEGCTQRFNTSGNLSRHKRIHSGERPYPCVFETCGKRFNTSTKLKRHMRIHFPDGQNLFQCVEPGCSWACDNYKEYVQHQRLHSSVAQGVKDDENVNRGNADFPPPSQPAQAAAKVAASRAPAKRKASPKPPMASNARPGRPGGPSIADIADISADESSYGVNPMDAYSQQSQPQPMGPTGLDFSGGEKDYYQDRNRSYPLMMMQQKEMPRDREDEYMSAPPQDSRRMKTYLDERPRLPFPTRAFPSEPIASASPSVQQGSVLGSSFHFHHMPPHRGPSYYEPSAPVSSGYGSSHTSSYGGGYSSYLRPSSENTMSSSYAPASNSYYQSESATLHFAPIRPEEPSDNEGDRYDSSPHSSQSIQQSIRGSAQGDGYSSSSNMNPAQAPEFTGEELSAVLELMKDS